MANTRTVELDEGERTEFLGTGGTGVLSFATGSDQPPYSLPVSYGYDETDGTFYFRLGFVADSRKADVVDEGRRVSFVTYDESDNRWQSVIATGDLEEVTESAINSDAMQGLKRVEIPMVDLFERETEDVTFRFFRLAAEDVSGRKEARSDR
ncbi:pyridoxamine 5'-phosphate oxidase family protein [Halorientalis brevis]|uniref:Pyridoxamine 5'-phosphate oxidase family protein n=1 Tax=Halorientalis brevis TaxID=1126241 RepID=A0ABD6C7L4_9EURY|nr:pyridoxamine 5'-phosphate oxidase family protein [Halorientalis brevis]